MKWLLISALLGAAGATATINRNSGDNAPAAVIGGQTSNGRALANNFGETSACRDGKYPTQHEGGVCP